MFIDTQDTSIQVLGRIFEVQMNFHRPNLLTNPFWLQNQNDLIFPANTNSFVGVLRETYRNVNSAAKNRPSVAKNKGANKSVINRKANNYLLRETKKVVVDEITIEDQFPILIL